MGKIITNKRNIWSFSFFVSMKNYYFTFLYRCVCSFLHPTCAFKRFISSLLLCGAIFSILIFDESEYFEMKLQPIKYFKSMKSARW